MREKELRIGLVCFGGISLAVYMHGVTKEILKLVRASSALHAIAEKGLVHRDVKPGSSTTKTAAIPNTIPKPSISICYAPSDATSSCA